MLSFHMFSHRQQPKNSRSKLRKFFTNWLNWRNRILRRTNGVNWVFRITTNRVNRVIWATNWLD